MIPEEAVEAAAKAYYEGRFGLKVWEDLAPVERLAWRNVTRPVLEAAGPHMSPRG